MNQQKRVMLLIDADNVSADVIDQAVGHVMEQHGAIHVRRAYCTAESAMANLQLFKRHSIRPIVNLSTGKNSTDISLAVDAVDLVLAERPDVVVVVSSDSDFAPLVIRLREKGCRVEGIGQRGKTGDDSKPVYDDFVDLVHKARGAGEHTPSGARTRAGASGPGLARAPARKRAALRPAAAAEPDGSTRSTPSALGDGLHEAVPDVHHASEGTRQPRGRRGDRAVARQDAPAEEPVPTRTRSRTNPGADAADRLNSRAASPVPSAASQRPSSSRSSSSRSSSSRSSSSEVTPSDIALDELQAPSAATRRAAPMPDDVARILAAVPDLWRGGKIELGVAAEQLRAGQLLAKSATSTRLFKKYPAHFALTPERQPNKVQYVGPRVV